MGGRLLTTKFNLPEKRLHKSEFLSLESKVLGKLRADFPDRRFESVPYLRDKLSFGDYDYCHESLSGKGINCTEYFSRTFDCIKPHTNGMTVSYPVGGFQCDQINVGSISFQTALDYYSYSSGLLIGVLANKIGCRYGHRGLELKVPLSEIDPSLPSHEHREVLITRDTKEIYSILGFDYERFAAGFDSQEELYTWVTESLYFAPQYYSYEQLNHQNATRNRKRPEYHAFLEFVKDREQTETIDKNLLRGQIFERFPFLREGIGKIKDQILLNKQRAAKFNGNLVRSVTNLEGKSLGEWIVAYKKIHPDFEIFLDSHSESDILASIQQLWSQQQKSA